MSDLQDLIIELKRTEKDFKECKDTCRINNKSWFFNGRLDEIESILLYLRQKIIIRGRDDLNSNKTPKEFCKDKDCVAKGD